MVVRVIDGVLRRLGRILLAWAVRRRQPAVTAVAWIMLTRRLRLRGTRGRRSRGRRVLVLHKVGGTEDLIASLEGRGRINMAGLRLQRADVKTVFWSFLDRDLDDFDYRPDDPVLDEAKLAYRDFLRAVVRRYARWLGVGAIVTGSITYFAERELAHACEQLGIPFLVVHKESIRTRGQRPRYERALRHQIGPFGGRAIGVYNAEEKQSHVAAGILASDRIEVVGCARADVLHRERAGGGAPDGRKLVVYFAIDPLAGTRTFAKDEQIGLTREDAALAGNSAPQQWHMVIEQTERALIDFARRRPDVDVVTKIKVGRRRQVVHRFADVALPANFQIVASGLATSLIKRAWCVVGLNTTALLEAVAAGRHAIVPRFGEAASPGAEHFLFDLGSAVRYADSPAAIGGLIDEALAGELMSELSTEGIAVLDRYLGNTDGNASDRVFVWLTRQLEAGSFSI